MVRSFETRPLFVILIHPKERRSRTGTGTGRITHLCISNSLLLEGIHFDENPVIEELLARPGYFPLVLFPGPEAILVDSEPGKLPLFSKNEFSRPVVFVIDGSWSCAKTLMNANKKLNSYPKISFANQTESRYLFKTQPKAGCLSTLESIHQLISLFNNAQWFATTPTNAHDNLLEIFLKMVGFQAAFTEIEGQSR